MNFRLFIENFEYSTNDVNKTLEKIPKSHRKLVADFKIEFEPYNTLKNDSKHIGFYDENKKLIKISAPWNYSREYALLHEIGHLVWNKLPNDKIDVWLKLTKDNKNKKENQVELFCQFYANKYAKNKLETYKNKKLINFLEKIN